MRLPAFALGMAIVGLSAQAEALTVVDIKTSSISMDLAGEVYGRFRARSIADEAFETPFDLSRARLKFSFRFGPWLRADVEPDFGGAQADLADVFLQIRPVEMLDVRIGQAKVPFGFLESAGRWRLPIQRRGMVNNIVFDRLGFSVRQIGARARVRLPQVALRPKVEVGVYGDPDNTFAEHAAARASLRLSKGLRLALAGYTVARAADNDARGYAGALSILMDKKGWFTGGEIQVGRARLLAATGLDPGQDASFLAARAIAAYRFDLGPSFTLQPYLSLELYEPNLSTSADLSFSGRGGLNLVWLKRLRLGVEADYQDGQPGAVVLKQTIVTGFVGVRLE